MAMLAAFEILNGEIVIYYENGNNAVWQTRVSISGDLKGFCGYGWKMRIHNPRGRSWGKIVCDYKFNYLGNVITRQQKFNLENGTLVIEVSRPGEDDYYLDCDSFNLAQVAKFYPNSSIELKPSPDLSAEDLQALKNSGFMDLLEEYAEQLRNHFSAADES